MTDAGQAPRQATGNAIKEMIVGLLDQIVDRARASAKALVDGAQRGDDVRLKSQLSKLRSLVDQRTQTVETTRTWLRSQFGRRVWSERQFHALDRDLDWVKGQSSDSRIQMLILSRLIELLIYEFTYLAAKR